MASGPTSTAAIPLGQLTVTFAAPLVNPAALYCGGGRLGNGACPQPGACCSKWGFCGAGHDYCRCV